MSIFDLSGKVILITGGAGVLGVSMAKYLAQNGATVVVLNRTKEGVSAAVDSLKSFSKNVSGYVCDVTDEKSLQTACDEIIASYKSIDVLINAAGGNKPGATIGEKQTFFDLAIDDFKDVVNLNLIGSVLPSLIFGKAMAENRKGIIINISSMAAQAAITRVVGYSASKAAIDNFTKWLSVEMALKFGEGIRVMQLLQDFLLENRIKRY